MITLESFIEELADLHKEEEPEDEHVTADYIKNDASFEECQGYLEPYIDGAQDDDNFVKEMYSLFNKAKMENYDALAEAIADKMSSHNFIIHQIKQMVESYDNDPILLAEVLASSFVMVDPYGLADALVEVHKYNDSLHHTKTLAAIKKMLDNDVFPSDEDVNHLQKRLKSVFGGYYLDVFDASAHSYLNSIAGGDLDTLGILPTPPAEDDKDNYTPKSLAQTSENSHLEEISEVEFHQLLPVIHVLEKLVPVSVKDLERKEQKLVAELAKLPEFKQFFGSSQAKQKPITKEFIVALEADLKKQGYPIAYGVWNSELQRSVADKEQIVLSICADDRHIEALKKHSPQCFKLFDYLTDLSEKKGHPYTPDDYQLGWVRLTIAEDKSYMLVDEIQSDFLREDVTNTSLGVGAPVSSESDMAFIKETFKDFEHVAFVTAQQFARKNGIKKIFYHTFEGGKKLKPGSNPPPHLYSSLPKSHFFKTTEEKPFNLPASFFMKKAELLLQTSRMVLAGDRTPTNPALWAKCQKLTKGETKTMRHKGEVIEGPNDGKGFKKFPSAYANGFCAKLYKRLGGNWKTKLESYSHKLSYFY